MMPTVEVILTDTPATPGPTPQCAAFPPVTAHAVVGVVRSPSKTATVVQVFPGRVRVLVAVEPASVKYFSVTGAGPPLGFWSVKYSEKKLRVDPSAKFHWVDGAVTPTMLVDPCQDPKLKFNVRSATPGPGNVTFIETCWLAPTVAPTSIS